MGFFFGGGLDLSTARYEMLAQNKNKNTDHNTKQHFLYKKVLIRTRFWTEFKKNPRNETIFLVCKGKLTITAWER